VAAGRAPGAATDTPAACATVNIGSAVPVRLPYLDPLLNPICQHECVGLGWDAVDLRAGDVYVTRVVVETSGRCELRNYPKSRAGIRRVPLPTFAVEALQRHRQLYTHSADLVCSTSPGGALRRSTPASGVGADA